MPCVYNLPKAERFCKFCSAWCDERPPEVEVITTTNTNPLPTKDEMKDELVYKLLGVMHGINTNIVELLWIEPESEAEEKDLEKVKGLLHGAYNALNDMVEQVIKQNRTK